MLCFTSSVGTTFAWKPEKSINCRAMNAARAQPIFWLMVDAEKTSPVVRRPVFHSP